MANDELTRLKEQLAEVTRERNSALDYMLSADPSLTPPERAKGYLEQMGADSNLNGLAGSSGRGRIVDPTDYKVAVVSALDERRSTTLQRVEPVSELTIDGVDDLDSLVEPLKSSALWMYEQLSPLVGGKDYFQYDGQVDSFNHLEGSFGCQYIQDGSITFGLRSKKNEWAKKDKNNYGVDFRIKRKLLSWGDKFKVKIASRYGTRNEFTIVERFINNLKKGINRKLNIELLRLEYLKHLLLFPKLVPEFVEQIKVESKSKEEAVKQSLSGVGEGLQQRLRELNSVVKD